jgi:hypothetical protein
LQPKDAAAGVENNIKLRGGHAPGHVRDAFRAAIEAFYHWNDGEPEPTVTFEINYEPVEIPISKACGLVWNCADILPGSDFTILEWCRIESESRTYAAAAHAMLDAIKDNRSTHYLS